MRIGLKRKALGASASWQYILPHFRGLKDIFDTPLKHQNNPAKTQKFPSFEEGFKQIVGKL
jgi:hypothetical protein